MVKFWSSLDRPFFEDDELYRLRLFDGLLSYEFKLAGLIKILLPEKK